MKTQSLVAILVASSLVSTAFADDLLGKDRRDRSKTNGQSSGGSSGGNGNSNPPQNRERRSDPPPTKADDRSRDRDRSTPRESSDRERPRESQPDRGNDVISRSRTRNNGSTYGGSSNNRSANPATRDREVINGRPESSDATRAARREGRPEVSDRGRYGYTHYDPNWRDDRWTYGFYRWNSDERSACSPWYDYDHLPGYVNRVRISFDLPNFSIRIDDRYCWDEDERRDAREYRRGDENLWRFGDEWVRAFQRRDINWFDRNIPTRGTVIIRPDDQRPYSISNDDFFDLIADCVESTRTREYKIVRVSRGWNGAELIMRHSFDDPWRRRQTVYHRLVIEQSNSRRSSFRIVEFQTSRWNPR